MTIAAATLPTPFTQLFGLTHPIALAPMAGVSDGRLAATVAAAGGLGLIGCGYGDDAWGGIDWLRREFAAARALPGGGLVGVGFITWSLAQRPGLLEAALAERPSAIMLSFGDPAPLANPIRRAGAKLICQVQTVDDARRAAAAGADLIVAQGAEAGGHGATRGTLTLVPAVVDAVAPIPVLAAGGIADGRGLAAVLCLGAAGALVGTRFFASHEAGAAAAAKQRILAGIGDDTLRTSVIDMLRGKAWPTPFTGRVIANRIAERWHGRENELRKDLATARAAYDAALARGDFDNVAVHAGEAIDLIDGIEPAAELVDRMVGEAIAILQSGTAATQRRESHER